MSATQDLKIDAGGADGDRYNGISRIDLTSGSVTQFVMPSNLATSEPVFVPRTESSPEGEGFLLATVYDSEIDKSHLAILDAENLEHGPLAKAMLDHRVPFGFHGNWRPST